ncbi:MAG: hypothetical protein H7839_15670 [Magnetococcus sp. YQC-5]
MTLTSVGIGNTQGTIPSLAQPLIDAQRNVSGGLKNDQASNHAAQLTITDRLSAQVQGFNISLMNVNDGIAASHVAESGLHEIQSNLQRMQELSVQGLQDTLSVGDRQNLQREANQLQQQIASTLANTQYNGIPLLTSGIPITFQTGANGSHALSIPMPDLTSAFTAINIETRTGAQDAVKSLHNDIQLVDQIQAQLVTARTKGSDLAHALMTFTQNLTENSGRIQTADLAQLVTTEISTAIRNQPNRAIQVQANHSPSQVQNLL